MALNRVLLIGNLTRDWESRYSPQGVHVAHSGIAVNRYSKTETGDYEVDFFNLTCFRKTADYASQYLAKGYRVAIEGRLQQRTWVDQTTGQNRSAVEILVDNIQNLTPREDGQAGAPAAEGEEEEDSFADDPATVQQKRAARAQAQPQPQPQAAPQQARAAAPPRQPAAAAAGATRRPAPAPEYDDLDESDPFTDEDEVVAAEQMRETNVRRATRQPVRN